MGCGTHVGEGPGFVRLGLVDAGEKVESHERRQAWYLHRIGEVRAICHAEEKMKNKRTRRMNTKKNMNTKHKNMLSMVFMLFMLFMSSISNMKD